MDAESSIKSLAASLLASCVMGIGEHVQTEMESSSVHDQALGKNYAMMGRMLHSVSAITGPNHDDS
jgi:hypothetical protein